jgi:predicted transcriptional regulator
MDVVCGSDLAAKPAIEAARAEVDAGKTIPYEKVRRWLLSWGTEKELPRPRRH